MIQMRILCALWCVLAVPAAEAELYFCQSQDGSFSFSRSSECGAAKYSFGDGHARAYARASAIPKNFQIFRPSVPLAIYGGTPIRDRFRYSLVVDQLARAHKLDPRLVHAVIANESSYNPNAVSPAGAVGLMQLMPGTASRYGVLSRTDPRANISGGIKYLADLVAMFRGDLSLALAAYNAGEGAVISHGYKVPPYRETRDYVRKVLASYQGGRVD